MNELSGQSGDVIFNGQRLHVTEWNATDGATLHDITNSGAGHFRMLTPGNKQATANVRAHWDGSINHGDPPLIRSGWNALLDLQLADGGDGLFGFFFVTGVEYMSAANGVVDYGFSAVSVSHYALFGEPKIGSFSHGWSSGFFV